ncbi:hypothetical protein ACFL1X_09020 [Candidatus Hydrogenedentota bacterium]
MTVLVRKLLRKLEATPLPESQKTAFIVLCMIVAATQFLSVFGGFSLDDFLNIECAMETPWDIRALGSGFNLELTNVTDGYLHPDLDDFGLRYFRPMFLAFTKMDIALWGLWAPGHHVTNIILQMIATLLVFKIAQMILGSQKQAFLAGALFAIAPSQAFTVAWVSGRTELLAAIFCFASVLAFLTYREKNSLVWYLVSAAMLVLALSSKEGSIAIPLVLLTADMTFEKFDVRRDSLRLLLRHAPFFAIVVAYLVIRHATLGPIDIPVKSFYSYGPAEEGFFRFFVCKWIFLIPEILLQIAAPMAATQVAILKIWYVIPVALLGIALLYGMIRTAGWNRRTLFFMGWIFLVLAPSSIVLINPYLMYAASAPLVLLVAPVIYRAFHEKTVPVWGRRMTKAYLLVWLSLGLFSAGVNSLALYYFSRITPRIAEDVAEHIKDFPRDARVMLLDLPKHAAPAASAIRLAAGRDIEVHVLNLSITMLGKETWHVEKWPRWIRSWSELYVGRGPSRIRQIDDHTFAIKGPDGIVYDNMSRMLLGMFPDDSRVRNLADTEVEMDGYSFRNRPSERSKFACIEEIVYTFDRPLTDKRNLFFQCSFDGGRLISFKETPEKPSQLMTASN